MNFERKLISTDQNRVNSETAQLEPKRKYFQDIATKCETVGITLNDNDLETLIATPKSFFVDKLTKGEPLLLSGVEFDKEQVYNMITKPHEVQEIVYKINNDATDVTKREQYQQHVDKFEVENNIVKIKPSVLVDILEQHSIYIENQTQLEVWELMQTINGNLNNLRSMLYKYGYRLDETDVAEIFNFDAPKQSGLIENTVNSNVLRHIK